jgi:hypothetical protein
MNKERFFGRLPSTRPGKDILTIHRMFISILYTTGISKDSEGVYILRVPALSKSKLYRRE